MDYIKLLMKQNEKLQITKEEAESVFDSIILDITGFNENDDDDMKEFITEDLCLFREREYVFSWFFDNENDGKIDYDLIDFTITPDMVGRKVKDILLESKENYLKINDNLYATWWI